MSIALEYLILVCVDNGSNTAYLLFHLITSLNWDQTIFALE